MVVVDNSTLKRFELFTHNYIVRNPNPVSECENQVVLIKVAAVFGSFIQDITTMGEKL